MVRRSKKFVQMLKKNVQACLQSPSESVNFVPYAAGYEAADMRDLASAVRQQASQEGLRPSSSAAAPRMWAMCKAMAFFLTPTAAKVLHVPPIPWNASYAKGLSQRLLATRKAKVQVMNLSHQHCKRRSFVSINMSQGAARATVAHLVALVKDCVVSVEKIGGHVPRCPIKYYESLASQGQPSLGYVQKLSMVLARSAKVNDLCTLAEGSLLELHSCNSGCAAGMQQITQDGPEQLKNKAFLRLRLVLLVQVIKQQWPKSAPRVPWSQGQRTEPQKAEAVAAQLCQWAKGNFGDEAISF